MNGTFLSYISNEQGVKSCVLLEHTSSICIPVSTSIHQNDIYYIFLTIPITNSNSSQKNLLLAKKDKNYSLKSYS